MSLTQTLTDNCKELGSKIELINSSKELGDNSPQLNTQNFFLRVGKPGKLFLQPNYTAFTKTSLGTIPSKIEKTLLKTDTNIPLTTNINTSLISTDSKFNSTTTNESVISSRDLKNYSKSFSKKGYGNGFVSKVARFNKFIKEYTPGPGDYNSDKIYTLENEIRKSDFGKSIFKDSGNRSLSLLNQGSPIEQKFFTSQERENLILKMKIEKEKGKIDINEELDKDDNKKGNYFFESKSNRFSGGLFAINNKNPGPGKYFINNEYKIHNKNRNSPNFIYPSQKAINPIQYFELNNNDKKELGFQIRDKIKNAKIATFWKGTPHLGKTYDFGDTISGEEKKIKKQEKILTSENIVAMPNFATLKEIRRNKFYRTNQQNLPNLSEENNSNNNIIRKLFKHKRKDLFGLASPRWDQGFFHDNGTHFQVPGPAYYEPRLITNKKSFNLNKKDFIYTNSVPYQTVNGNMLPFNDF